MMRKKKSTNEGLTTPQRLSSIVKSVRDIMRKDKGLSGDLDRIPMITWIMFLKFLDDHEQIREAEVKLSRGKYQSIIEAPYRWRDWAEKDDGITGDELIAFVNQDEAVRPDGVRGFGLFAYLRSLSGSEGRDRRDVVATVFKGVSNRMINGYLLRDVINKIDEIHFSSTEEIHTLAFLYESLLKEMRDSAGDSGEFYTPRPVIKFMVQVVNPQLGDTILDPAAGTGGFLIESFEHVKAQCKKAEDFELLQNRTLFGFEAKPLPFLLCQMNMLLHGVESPDIDPGNALRFPLREIGDRDRVDVILTNPPFGGEEEKGILSNFPEDKQTAETALLFLQLIMRKLKRSNYGTVGGRCGMVVPNGLLLGGEICARIKKELLDEFNLDTIIRLPRGVFSPYTDIETNLLFFNKDGPTKEIWYYEVQLPLGKKQYTKTKPITYKDFTPIIEWWSSRKENEFCWKIKIEDVIINGYNLDIKNPKKINDINYLSSNMIVNGIIEKERQILDITQKLKVSLSEQNLKEEFQKMMFDEENKIFVKPLSQYSTIIRGKSPIYQEGSGKIVINQKCVKWSGIEIEHGKEVSPEWILSLPTKNIIKENDLLVNSTGEGTIGRACVATSNAIGLPFDSHVLVVRTNTNLSPSYVAYFIRSPIGQNAIENSKGAKTTKQTELGTKKLGEIMIPIIPLEKQNILVMKLDKLQIELESQVIILKTLQTNLTTALNLLSPSLLNEVFEQSGRIIDRT